MKLDSGLVYFAKGSVALLNIIQTMAFFKQSSVIPMSNEDIPAYINPSMRQLNIVKF